MKHPVDFLWKMKLYDNFFQPEDIVYYKRKKGFDQSFLAHAGKRSEMCYRTFYKILMSVFGYLMERFSRDLAFQGSQK